MAVFGVRLPSVGGEAPSGIRWLYRRHRAAEASPKAVSGENEISPGLIGLSPLSTGSSPPFSTEVGSALHGVLPRFSLPMDRSPRLRVRGVRLTRPLEARFRCGSFPNLTSPHAATRWLILQKARRHPARGLRLLAGARFQALFHSPLGVLFTFPSRYLFAIGRGRVFSLGGWSPLLPAGFLVPGGTLGRRRSRARLRVRGSHPVPPAFPGRSRCARGFSLRAGSRTPARAAQQPPSRQPSWGMRSRGFGPGPVSLAATPGISVDFSSSGVLRCFSSPGCPPRPMCSGAGTRA